MSLHLVQRQTLGMSKIVYLGSLELGCHCLLGLLSNLELLCQLVLAADTVLQLQLHCSLGVLQCSNDCGCQCNDTGLQSATGTMSLHLVQQQMLGMNKMLYLGSLELGCHCPLCPLSNFKLLCQLVLAADTVQQLQIHCLLAILQCSSLLSMSK